MVADCLTKPLPAPLFRTLRPGVLSATMFVVSSTVVTLYTHLALRDIDVTGTPVLWERGM